MLTTSGGSRRGPTEGHRATVITHETCAWSRQSGGAISDNVMRGWNKRRTMTQRECVVCLCSNAEHNDHCRATQPARASASKFSRATERNCRRASREQFFPPVTSCSGTRGRGGSTLLTVVDADSTRQHAGAQSQSTANIATTGRDKVNMPGRTRSPSWNQSPPPT
jgi:hypothetical protein